MYSHRHSTLPTPLAASGAAAPPQQMPADAAGDAAAEPAAKRQRLEEGNAEDAGGIIEGEVRI